MNVYKDTINELSMELDKKSRLIQKQQLMLKVRKLTKNSRQIFLFFFVPDLRSNIYMN